MKIKQMWKFLTMPAPLIPSVWSYLHMHRGVAKSNTPLTLGVSHFLSSSKASLHAVEHILLYLINLSKDV